MVIMGVANTHSGDSRYKRERGGKRTLRPVVFGSGTLPYVGTQRDSYTSGVKFLAFAINMGGNYYA